MAIVDRPAPGYQPAPGAGTIVPQTWTEWMWSVYPPDIYIVQWQQHACTIAVAANSNNQPNNIQVPVKFYCFGFNSCGVVAATGNAPTIPYRIGIKNGTGNNWTDGQFMAQITTGDGGPFVAGTFREWMLPRELGQNEVVVVTVDNTVNAAAPALIVDASIWGYEVRNRNQPIERR